ncbi:MAG: hypothetical protein NTV45_04875, partial [Firmicutes bacterium]|nr:hypothetical protein [Bacillota bacterium]
MVIQFTLQDLMIFLVCAFVIAAGALSIPILWNINKMVGALRPLIDKNKESLHQSLQTMPGILGNVEQISSDVRETA